MKNHRWVYGLLLLVVLGGALVRSQTIHTRLIWADEALTWHNSVHVDFRDFVRWENHHHHPPLSYLLTRLSVELAGTQAVWALRLPALIAGILCIPAAFALGRNILGNAMGLWLAALVAFDPNMVNQSQQARMYSLLALFMLLALAWLVKLLHDSQSRPWPWVGLGVVLGLQLWSSMAAVLLWFGMLLGVAIVLVKQRQGLSRKATISGMALAFVTALFMSHVGVLKLLNDITSSSEGHAPPAMSMGQIITSAADAGIHLIGLGVIGSLVYLLAILGLVLLWRRCAIAVIVIVTIALVSLVSIGGFTAQRYGGVFPRYFTTLQPALWVGLASLPVVIVHRWWRMGVVGMMLIFLAAQGWQCFDLSDWRPKGASGAVARHVMVIGQQRNSQDAVIYCPGSMEVMGDYLGVPATRSVTLHIWDYNFLRQDVRLPDDFQAPATWVLDYNLEGEIYRTNLMTIMQLVAEHYGQAVDIEQVDQARANGSPFLTRISAEGIEYGIKPNHTSVD